jgi:cyclophilin family peptidyl-prolyl cis-trans isomerase
MLDSDAPASDARRIGPYRIIRELGRGGMGTVYLCADTGVGDRLVALKVVHDPRGVGSELLERFRREIRNLGVLRHPNIVQVLYAGEHEHHPYFVMEYVRGRELNKWLDEVALLPEPDRITAIVRLMAKVCRGVAHAHHNDTIHRDLKPQNILVREDGEPLVLDFGIAKHSEDTTLTASASAPGTPSHMAPEQFDPTLVVKENLIDVWALGTILYQALTRERPFRGQSLASVSYQIVHSKPVSIRKLNPQVPPVLEDLVVKCLEKDPRKRPQSADVLAEKLEASVHDVVHAAQTRRVRAIAMVAAAALVVAALVVQPWKWWQRAPSFGHLVPVLEEVSGTRVSSRDREVVVQSFQPDLRVRFADDATGALLEAAIFGDDGAEIERALLAPGPGGVHHALLTVPAMGQKPGMRVAVEVFANKERLRATLPLLILSPEVESRPVPEPVLASESRPESRPEPIVESRPQPPESAPASRTPVEPPLPDVWGRIRSITRGAEKFDPEKEVRLEPGVYSVSFDHDLGQQLRELKLRIVDKSGTEVAAAGLTSLIGGRTLLGTLDVGAGGKGRQLTAQLVLTDAKGTTRTQTLVKPRFVEGVSGPRKATVKLATTAGDLEIELDRTLSGDAVEAFLQHVRNKDYDGVIFHDTKYKLQSGLYSEPDQLKNPPLAKLPAEWDRSKNKCQRMTVAMTGEAEFIIFIRDSGVSGAMDLIERVEIGRVVGAPSEKVVAQISESPQSRPVRITGATVEKE